MIKLVSEKSQFSIIILYFQFYSIESTAGQIWRYLFKTNSDRHISCADFRDLRILHFKSDKVQEKCLWLNTHIQRRKVQTFSNTVRRQNWGTAVRDEISRGRGLWVAIRGRHNCQWWCSRVNSGGTLVQLRPVVLLLVEFCS